MRITLINSLYFPYQMGGAEKSVQYLAEALSRLGHDVSVIALHPEGDVKQDTHNGVNVFYVPLANGYWPFDPHATHGIAARTLWHMRNIWNSRTAVAAGRLLDELKPDVVHVNIPVGFSAAVLSQVLLRRIRLVQTLRDYTFVCERAKMFRAGKNCKTQCIDCRLFTSQYKRLSHQVSAVVSNSQFVLDAHLECGYFKGVPAHVIFNIADVDGKVIPRSLSDDSTNRIAFGFFGQIVTHKGLDVVLEATRRVKNDNWSLKIGGTGPDAYVSELKHRYVDPRIEWLGFVEPRRFFEQVDVVVVPSIWQEPLPRSMIESYAAGRTVIASRSGGNLDVATLGKTYATYDAENVAELAALLDAATSAPTKWRDGGFVSHGTSKLFSEATVTGQYLKVYQGA